MKIEVDVPTDSRLTDVTQKGVRFPDGTIIWAKPGFDGIELPITAGGIDRKVYLLFNGKKNRVLYTYETTPEKMTAKYQAHLRKLGANYDPEHDTLELVERMILIGTGKPTIVKV